MGTNPPGRRKRKKKVRFKPRFFVFLAVFLFLVFFGISKLISAIAGLFAGDSQEAIKKEIPVQVSQKAELVDLSVTVAGDLVIHAPVFNAHKTASGFDFTPPFKYIKKYIKGADASICTFEGSLVDSGFTGYPLFRTPGELARDMKKVGFDLMTITSNHANDGGTAGFDSTLKKTKNAGLIPSGGQAKADDPDYAMIKVKNGIKIAFISFSYSDGSVSHPALNGNVLADDMKERCNTFTMKDKEGATEDAARIEKQARKAGADIVILSMHWGEEYQTHSNEEQQKLAQMLCDETTCDIIVASHPHVVQECRMLTSKDGARQVPCFFAIGNLLSNQRREYLRGDIHVEEGVLAQFKIKYDTGSKKIRSLKTKRIPYWVDRYNDSKGAHYDIIPLTGDFGNNATLVKSGHGPKAEEAFREINRILDADKGKTQ